MQAIPRERPGSLGTMAFSRDEKLAALLISARTIQVVDIHSGDELGRFEARGAGRLQGIALGDDNRWLAASGPEVDVWNLEGIGAELGSIGLGVDLGIEGTPRRNTRSPLLRVDPGHFEDPALWPVMVSPVVEKDVLERISRRIEQDPRDENALRQRAVILGRMGRWEEALRDRDRELELARDPRPGMVARARILEILHQFERAASEYTELLRRDPESVELLLARARCHEALRRPDLAISDLERILLLDDRHLPALQGLAWILSMGPSSLRDPVHADGLAHCAVEIAPADPVSLRALACAAYRRGRFQEAARHARNALGHGRDEDEAMNCLVLALCTARLGREDESRELLARARSGEGPVAYPALAALEALRAEVLAVLVENNTSVASPR